jgi:formate dehydrogenase maturation protein FdhE
MEPHKVFNSVRASQPHNQPLEKAQRLLGRASAKQPLERNLHQVSNHQQDRYSEILKQLSRPEHDKN